MATTADLLARHNALAAELGAPTLRSWKRPRVELEARVDALEDRAAAARGQAAVAAAAEHGADVLELSAGDAEPLGEAEPSDARPTGAESAGPEADERGDAADEPAADLSGAPTDPQGSISALVRELVETTCWDYGSVVEYVRRRHPGARTTRRSVASVAADLRKRGVDVPLRRNVGAARAAK